MILSDHNFGAGFQTMVLTEASLLSLKNGCEDDSNDMFVKAYHMKF